MSPELTLAGEFGAHLAAISNGAKPYPVASGDRHHFVPVFLLRRFCGRSQRGKRLYVLDKITGEIEESTPKDAAWRHRLYSIESIDGQHDGFVEGLFGLAENYAAPSLDRLLNIADPATFSVADRGNLSAFIAAQEHRVPGALEELRSMLAVSGNLEAAVELANAGGSARKRRLAKEGYRALTDGEIRLEPPTELVLDLAVAATLQVGALISRLPWTLMKAGPDTGGFVSSDRPLTMFDPCPPHKWASPAWLSSPEVAAALPLSSQFCLRISPRDPKALRVRSTVKQVARINRFTYGAAERHVFGASPASLEKLHAWAREHPKEVPKQQPKTYVLLEDIATADPGVAEQNKARGWDPYLDVREDDGSMRRMSYQVVSSVEHAMSAVAPRPASKLAGLDLVGNSGVFRAG